MTLYLVKHGKDDYRLHRDNGDEISNPNWSERPTKMDMVEALAEEHNGASILANPNARLEYTEIITGEVSFRNQTLDESTVPWQ
jgi:hypothetical protein